MNKTLAHINSLPIKVNREIILTLISFIDLTLLDANNSSDQIEALISKANKGIDTVFPAAVCVYSTFSYQLKDQLNPTIKTAVVGASFPSGQLLSEIKIEAVKQINHAGIDEIDVVLNRGLLKSGKHKTLLAEIKSLKVAAGEKCLKLILETGELNESEIIQATQLGIQGGADFIKTSTGKVNIGATPASVLIICQELKSHALKTGQKIGLKISGGVRTFEDAIFYYKIVTEVLGNDWLTSELFRIGASSLYDNLIIKLAETE